MEIIIIIVKILFFFLWMACANPTCVWDQNLMKLIKLPLYYRRLGINCELRVFLCFAINRFANINVHVYYSTVWGRPS